MARRYSRTAIADEKSYEYKLELTRRYLKREMNLLEIGCGTGGTAIRHSPHVNHIHAVDFSENMLGIAKERAATAAVQNVDFECLALFDLDQKRAYDMVLALSLLHLIPDWKEALARIHSLLPAGGLFVSSSACLADDYGFMRYIGPPGRWIGLLPELSFFGEDEFLTALEQQGFDIVERWKRGMDMRASDENLLSQSSGHGDSELQSQDQTREGEANKRAPLFLIARKRDEAF